MAKRNEPFDKIDLLGTGGFAHTWSVRVIDPDLVDEWKQEVVAIKIPLTKEKEKILKREIQINGSLQLKLTPEEATNIAQYLGFEIFDQKFVMVMEYIKGGNLRERMRIMRKQKKSDINEAIFIAKGVLNGLSIIHKNNIVHRDIKPENILMDGDIPKIGDFGIGRLLSATHEYVSSAPGTYFYMSPESLYKVASYNSDIWSFGVTLYEMLCGVYPFGITGNEPHGIVIDRICNPDIKLEFPKDANIPSQLEVIVSKALEKDRNLRYQTADEMLKDIEKFCNEEAIERELHEFFILTDSVAKDIKLDELLERFQDFPLIYLRLGEHYNREGNYDKAVEMFYLGMEKNPENSMIRWGLAVAYYRKHDFKSARNTLQELLNFQLDSHLEQSAKSLLKLCEKFLPKGDTI